ncbi:MAG: phosphate signaling complex protein PhoU [Microbacteriaceae bacterium]|nr:phosphate signaling complex protein PhoU [Microbacteriaceae bacterium]MCL2793837.1 phosphate signaling complex protein PhoU [Microbacteriaceae bacterium]
MRRVFQLDLETVQDNLVRLADLVLEAVTDATTAFNTADLARAEGVISGDAAIDALAIELDELAIGILQRQSPVAHDLRIVVSALRMSTALERMGDLAHHLAALTRRRYPAYVAPAALRDAFLQLSAQAVGTAAQLRRLLATQDMGVAQQLIDDDAAMDALHRHVLETVTDGSWAASTQSTVDTTLAARYFERFGDQAVSIARKVQYLSTGDWAAHL